jgi:predicted dehydrogenase
MSGTLLLLGAAHVHLSDHLRVADEAGWKVTACHDRDPDRRDRMARELGARALAELPEEGSWDAAIVCSETVHHAADIDRALDLGLPVFTEKPLAGSAAAAVRLAGRAEAEGARLVTNFFLRTNPAVQALRAALEAGEIGDVIEARLRFAHDGGFADWVDVTGWMSDPERARYGGFADEGVHVLDLALSLLGPLAPEGLVLGHTLGLGTDDHGTALLSTRGGAPVTVEAGWTDTAMRLELDFVGTLGRAMLDRTGLAIALRDGSERHASAAPLDSGTGFHAFLGGENLAPPREAAAVNAVLDALMAR